MRVDCKHTVKKKRKLYTVCAVLTSLDLQGKNIIHISKFCEPLEVRATNFDFCRLRGLEE
jgi:hypothetical protein